MEACAPVHPWPIRGGAPPLHIGRLSLRGNPATDTSTYLGSQQAPRRSVEEYNPDHTCRAIIIFLISAIALAGLSPFGQVLAQFMIVWQR